MSEPLSPLDADLRALLDAEAAAPPRDDLGEMRARSRAMVLARIGFDGGGGGPGDDGGPGDGGGPAPSRWVGPAAAAGGGAVVALVLGVAVGQAVGPVSVIHVPVVVEVPIPVPVEVPVPVPVEVPVPTPVEAPVPLPASAAGNERATIDRARIALLRGDASEALITLMGHERQFPNGALAEEREVSIVEALIALGRREEAIRRAAAFRARYPHSVHASRLDGL